MAGLSLVIRPERPGDAEAIERLHARAFGPGRYARTAFRLREGAAPMADLSFTALLGTCLVGSVRVVPVRAVDRDVLMLGPLSVDPSYEGRGIGSALMRASLEAATTSGHGLVLLVGDGPFYARFGFARVPAGRLVLPGPVDPARILWCELRDGARARTRGLVTGIRG